MGANELITNNLGTLIYSFLCGKKVGEDKNGNKFYINKYNNKKKWVIYNKIIDPTSLMVAWQIWLTNKEIEPPMDLTSKKKYLWQKERKPNYSGTKKSYHPKISKNINLKNKVVKEFWSPE